MSKESAYIRMNGSHCPRSGPQSSNLFDHSVFSPTYNADNRRVRKEQ